MLMFNMVFWAPNVESVGLEPKSCRDTRGSVQDWISDHGFRKVIRKKVDPQVSNSGALAGQVDNVTRNMRGGGAYH